MGTSAWMSQEGADSLGGFRREDVLEFAGFFRDLFFIVHVKGLGKEALGQAMAANDVFSALAAFFREDDHVIAVAGVLNSGTERHMATVEHLLVRVRLQSVLGEIFSPRFFMRSSASRMGSAPSTSTRPNSAGSPFSASTHSSSRTSSNCSSSASVKIS